jgi:hypothetical protein
MILISCGSYCYKGMQNLRMNILERYETVEAPYLFSYSDLITLSIIIPNSTN